MAKDPLYAWLIRGFFLLVLLLVCHLVLKALEWTIGLAYAAVLLVIAALFIASWVFKLALLPALVAWAMMILIVAFYAVLERFAHFGNNGEPMGWTQRISAVLLLFFFALILCLLTDRDCVAPGLMVVLFVVGLGCLAYADSRFLLEPLLGPRAAPRVTVADPSKPFDPRRPLDGVAATHGALWSIALVWVALRRRWTPETSWVSSESH